MGDTEETLIAATSGRLGAVSCRLIGLGRALDRGAANDCLCEGMEREEKITMDRVYPDKRKGGYWVLIEFTGVKISGEARRIWPTALHAPRKPMRFESYKAAQAYRDAHR